MVRTSLALAVAVGLALIAAVSLITAASAAAGNGNDKFYAECSKDDDDGGGDPATVAAVKRALVGDLLAHTTKDQSKLYYCNHDTRRGVTMWGYASCAQYAFCLSCLNEVSNELDKKRCHGGGTGWDFINLCYIKVGFSRAGVCSKVVAVGD